MWLGFLRSEIDNQTKGAVMVKINLIGDYEGPYRISVVEWVLMILNMMLLMGLVLYQQLSN